MTNLYTLRFLCFLFLSSVLPLGLLATDIFDWTGNGDGVSWNDTGNWNCSGCTVPDYPGSSINEYDWARKEIGGDVVLNQPIHLAVLEMEAGNLNGSGSVTIVEDGSLGLMIWTIGDIHVPLTIESQTNLLINSADSKGLYSTLSVDGSVFHSGGTLTVQSGQSISVSVGALYDIDVGSVSLTGSATFDNYGDVEIRYSGTAFANAGAITNHSGATFTRSSGSGAVTIDGNFINNGTFDHDSGSRLDFNGQLTVNGAMNFQGSEELETDLVTLTAGGSLNLGTGQLWDAQDIVTLNQNFSTDAAITAGNGINGTGDLTITTGGSLTWQGGNIRLPITVDSGATFNFESSVSALSESLQLDGTTNHSSGTFVLEGGSNLVNNGTYIHTGGSIAINGGQSWIISD